MMKNECRINYSINNSDFHTCWLKHKINISFFNFNIKYCLFQDLFYNMNCYLYSCISPTFLSYSSANKWTRSYRSLIAFKNVSAWW